MGKSSPLLQGASSADVLTADALPLSGESLPVSTGRRRMSTSRSTRQGPVGQAHADTLHVPTADVAVVQEEDGDSAVVNPQTRTRTGTNLRSAGDSGGSTDDLDYDLELQEEIEALRASHGQTMPQSQARHFQHTPLQPVLWLLAGMVVLVLIYTAAFWMVTFCSAVGNHFAYGSTYTFNADVQVRGTSTHVTAVNNHGTILITLTQIQQGKLHAQTLVGQALDPAAWGDLDAITVTVTAQRGGTLLVDLSGAASYTHLLFARPTLEYRLVPDKNGNYAVA